ncbi:MAG: hypothetical protein QMB72_10205 [Brachymonas denitrificans]|jgi:hypothetical protein|uniref:hypothetical protein n=1 Tax=Brachymonas denitrificans TaxID=28220 RepID=UPI001BD04E6E|nr:hypothetical protein [Brachymonas denitrificans]
MTAENNCIWTPWQQFCGGFAECPHDKLMNSLNNSVKCKPFMQTGSRAQAPVFSPAGSGGPTISDAKTTS